MKILTPVVSAELQTTVACDGETAKIKCGMETQLIHIFIHQVFYVDGEFTT